MPEETITAVMLTRPQREWRAWRSIHNFSREGTPGRRLLVYTEDRPYAERLQQQFPQVELRTFDGSPLEALRHAAGDARAHGGHFALWDDDDQYSLGRLNRQRTLVEENKNQWPAFLSAGLWHFFETGEIFVYDLDKRFQNLRIRLIPSTLLCRADDRLDGWFKNLTLKPGQSPSAALSRNIIGKTDCVRPMREYQWVLIGVGGDNANGYEWHRSFVGEAAKCRDVGWIMEKRGEIEMYLQRFLWEPDAHQTPSLDVCGRDGVAFGLVPELRWPDHFPRPVPSPPASDVDVIVQDVGQPSEETKHASA